MSKNIYNPLNLDNPIPFDFDDLSDHEPFAVMSGDVNPFYGKKHTPKALQQCASFGFKGKKHSPETIEKITKARKGFKHSPESIQKMRGNQTWLGRKHTPETIKKMSESAKKRTTPGGFSGRKHTPETKKKISEVKRINQRNRLLLRNADIDA